MLKINNIQTNFGKAKEADDGRDKVLKANFATKTKANIETAKSLPGCVARGMQGDPDANFYEFSQITKIPYFLGGPGLVATILAGSSLLDMKANNAAKFNGKGMALGCIGYYLMAAIAKACIDIPLKAARGLDLNQPVKVHVYNKPHDSEGHSDCKLENHKLFESSKFIRWDMVSPNEENFEYKKMQKKMGIPEDANNPDAMMRPIISSTIKRANAWKYLTSAFAVMLGVGFGNQQALKEGFMTGVVSDIKNIKNTKFSIKNISDKVVTKVAKPVAESFKSLWKGADSLSSKITGKVAILGFAASVIAANISVLSNSKVKNVQEKEVK